MLESQAADSHISEPGTEQTVGDSHIDTVGEQTGSRGSSHTPTAAAEEIDEIWGFELPQEDDYSQDPEEAPPNPENEEENPLTDNQEESQEEAPGEDGEEALEEEDAALDDTDAAFQDTLTLNFLGKKLDMPLDEVKNLAERGLNVDRLQGKYEKLKPLEPLLDALETAAYLYDVPMDQLVANISSLDGLKQGEVQRLMAEGASEQAAIEACVAKIEAAQAKRERANAARGGGLTSDQREQVRAFQSRFPEVDQEISQGMEIPQEVIKDWQAGSTLTEAWLAHQHTQIQEEKKDLENQVQALKQKGEKLKKDLKNLQKNIANKAKAPSSKRGTGGGSGHDNPFSGWDKF